MDMTALRYPMGNRAPVERYTEQQAKVAVEKASEIMDILQTLL